MLNFNKADLSVMIKYVMVFNQVWVLEHHYQEYLALIFCFEWQLH